MILSLFPRQRYLIFIHYIYIGKANYTPISFIHLYIGKEKNAPPLFSSLIAHRSPLITTFVTINQLH